MSLNIALIRASFEEVKPIAEEVITHFYNTLFQNYPASQGLFEKTDMTQQKKALISSLVTIVDNLDKPDNLVSYLKKLGARHTKYGTQEEHYAMVGKSLLSTFRHFFGSNWTSELEDQWILAIGIIAEYMITGAKEAQPAAPVQKIYEVSQNTQNVQSHPPTSQKNEPQDLSQTIRQMARNLLYKVLEQESDGEFMKLARKKASNMLMQAIREETDLIQEQFSMKKKAS